MKKLAGSLSVAALVLAAALPAAPAHAVGGITNFTITNCTQRRLYVCSFDKTDSLMATPYKSGGVQPGDRKEFGCASLNKCKVIIGVSRQKNRQTTLSAGMEALVASGAAVVGAAGGAVVGGAIVAAAGTGVTAGAIVAGGILAAPVGAVLVTVSAGIVIGALEVADGMKDGKICDRVRKAAQKAGAKPKSFLKDGNSYQVVEKYAVDENGNFYVNPDGTAVFSYDIDKGRVCPAPLFSQLVPD